MPLKLNPNSVREMDEALTELMKLPKFAKMKPGEVIAWLLRKTR